MKKPYQIEAQRAVKQLEAMATDGKAVQMMLPMAEMVGWLRKGVGKLVRQASLQVMELLMQEEVRELVGERGSEGQRSLAGCRHSVKVSPALKFSRYVSTLSEVTRRSELEDDATVDRRVSFDRAVSREPPAVAADAARMHFECCFGTSVPSFGGASVVFG